MSKGKMLFQVKRVLAMFLAVAMVVTMLPTTSYAAFDAEDAVVQNDVIAYGTGDGGDEVTLKTAISIELEDEDTSKEYTGYGVFKTLDEFKNYVKVTVNDEEVVPNTEDIVLTWKAVGADGKLADLLEGTTEPVNAGKYNLAVELRASEGLYAAAEVEGGVEFTITPTTITVVPNMGSVTPGTKVSDLVVTDADAVAVNGTRFVYAVDNAETKDVNEADESQLAITVSVRDAITGATLGADAVLLKNGDYVYDFEATFTEKGKEAVAGNYTINKVDSQDVVVSDEIPVRVKVTLSDTWKEAGKITHTYNGKEVATPVKGTDFTAEVCYDSGEVDEEGNVIYTTVEGAQTTEAWYELTIVKEYVDAEGNAAYDWEWVQLDKAPTEAGSYAYRISYAGEEGLYTEAYGDIMVVIEPVDVVIKPVLSSSSEVFYHQMTEAEVLAKIGYEVYDTAETPNKVNVDKEIAWGVWRNQNSSISYEPVFKLQQMLTDVSGNAVLDVSGNAAYTDNNNASLDASKKYRVVFTGNKAVYNDNGTVFNTKPINEKVNASNLNYMVETDYMSAICPNALEITVEAGEATVVDTSVITGELGNKGESLDNPYTKVYDGIALYENRAAYKKAVVKAGDKEVAKDTDDALTYTWYRHYQRRYSDYTDYLITDATGEKWVEADPDNFNNPANWEAMSSNSIPSAAGVYKLVITYDDAEKNEYHASSAAVYYAIDKAQVKATLTGEYKVLSNTNIADFIKETEANIVNNHALYQIDGETETKLNWTYDIYYDIDVEVLETLLVPKVDVSGNEVLDDKGEPVMVPATRGVYHYCAEDGGYYEALDADGKQLTEEDVTRYYYENDNDYSYGTFREDAIYQVTADVNFYIGSRTDEPYVFTDYTFIKDAETNEKVVHTVRETESLNDKIDITVEKMGDKVIEIVVDEDKLGTLEKEYDGMAFDLQSVIKDAVKVVYTAPETPEAGTTDGETEKVLDLPLTYEWYGTDWDDYGYRNTGYLPEAVDAGEYTLYASYYGDTTYAAADRVAVATVTITPKEVTVTVPEMTTTAGQSVGDFCNGYFFQTSLGIEGMIPAEAYAFEYDSYMGGFSAWGYNKIEFEVYDAETEERLYYDDVLKGEKTYTVKGISTLSAPYSNNYTVDYKEGTFTTVRGYSDIYYSTRGLTTEYLTNEVVYEEVSEALGVTRTGMNSVIRPAQAIPYSYHTYTGERTYGNFFEFAIVSPAEYEGTMPATAMYVNSIEAAGGTVNTVGNWIYVIFDAAQKDVKEFDVRWEDGYVEHFTVDFSKAELMGNLAEAVAPKSISFNSPAKKMAVGEGQQLDLKLAKVQMNDIVCIAYDVDNKSVLSVDANGYATALKEGSATVTAYPTKLVDGQQVAIAGAKTAKVKISVKAVTAPKVKKATAIDDTVTVQYSVVPDGYRRELYVLEGKNVKADVFEAKIDSVNNGAWKDVFAIAPVYLTPSEEANMHPVNAKGVIDYKTIEVRLSGLDSSTSYTVYVRNVSCPRNLDDGSVVTLSANGGVKSFATTKVQVDALSGSVNATYGYSSEYGVNRYEVKLADKKTNVSVLGRFGQKAKDQSADAGDTAMYSLPLSKELTQYYVNPKLTYGVYTDATRMYKSAYATISKKGVLTYKGVGIVYVSVEDTNTGVSAGFYVEITAKADKVKANKVTLGVGESVSLEDMLTYYEGKTKLIGDYDRWVVRDDKLLSAFANNEYFELDSANGIVTAVKAGGKLQLSLTDSYVQANGGAATATVTVTSKALATIKGLKIANTKVLSSLTTASLTDNYARIQFNYDGGANYFKIEVKDSRGRVIRSSMQDRYSLYTWGTDNKLYYYSTITGLTQQSKYSVTVTPVYWVGESITEAKAAKLSVKTTKRPASTRRLRDNENNTGLEIWLALDNYNDMKDEIIDGSKVFMSGNTYSLYAVGDNRAEATGSDKLVWSSSNKKVATVTANGTSNYATFKALKSGTTTIEIKSSVTKEIIARYTVEVAAVGDGYAIGRRYYGDNQPDGLDVPQNIEEIEIGNGTSITVKAKSEKWVAYTADKDGMYTFNISNGKAEFYPILGQDPVATGTTGRCVLKTNETIYIKLINTSSYSVNITINISSAPYSVLKIGSPVTMNETELTWLEFTAPSDGIYMFESISDMVNYTYYYLYESLEESYKKYDSANGKLTFMNDMKAGQTIYLQVYGQDSDTLAGFSYQVTEFEPENLTAGEGVKVQKDTYESVWFEYTATEKNVYTFTATVSEDNNNASARIRVYKKISEDYVDYDFCYAGDSASVRLEVLAGEKVYVEILPVSSGYVLDATLTVTKYPVLEAGKDVSMNAASGEYAWAVFTAPETSVYAFELSDSAVVSSSNIYVYKDVNNSSEKSASNSYGKAQLLYQMENAETIYVRYRAVWSGEETSYGVKVVKFVPQQLTMENDVTVAKGAGEVGWIAFTAPETNVYTFIARPNVDEETGTATGNYMYIYDELFDGKQIGYDYGYNTNVGECEIEIAKGETVYIKVRACNEYYASNVTLDVTAPTIAAVGSDANLEIPSGNYGWYAFTASEEGMYKFSVSRADAEDTTSTWRVDLYRDKDGYSETGILSAEGESVLVAPLAAGEDVYFRVDPYSGFTDTLKVKLNVTKETVTEMNGELSAVTVAAGETKYYVYRAAQTGRYTITKSTPDATDAAKLVAFLMSGGSCEESFSTTATSIERESLMASGDALYFVVSNSLATDAAVSLSVSKENYTQLSLNSPVTMSSVNEYVEFVAPSEGLYEYTVDRSNASSYINYAYYTVIGGKIESSTGNYLDNGSESSRKLYMQAGDVVYFVCTYNYSEEEYTLRVNKAQVSELRLNQRILADLDTDESIWCEFAAPEDGEYRIYGYSYNYCDTYGKLYYGTNFTSSIGNDSDANNGHFAFTRTMKKGERVLLEAYGWNGNPAEFEIVVEKVE